MLLWIGPYRPYRLQPQLAQNLMKEKKRSERGGCVTVLDNKAEGRGPVEWFRDLRALRCVRSPRNTVDMFSCRYYW